eukprot:1419509-Pyramimonas_sp.AAC.1
MSKRVRHFQRLLDLVTTYRRVSLGAAPHVVQRMTRQVKMGGCHTRWGIALGRFSIGTVA